MKFLKKAFKKVFKPIKKFAKSTLGKTVLTVGATLFAAGLGTVGFGAFKGATGIQGILGAAGRTIAAGAQGLLGAVGIGQGVSENLAGQISGAEGGETLFGMGGLFGGTGTSTAQLGANTQTTQQNSRILSGLGGSFNGFGGMMLAQGIMGGVQAYFQGEERDRQQRISDRRNFYGGPARGGVASGGPVVGYEGQGALARASDFSRGDEDLMQDPTQQQSIFPQMQIDPLASDRSQPVGTSMFRIV